MQPLRSLHQPEVCAGARKQDYSAVFVFGCPGRGGEISNVCLSGSMVTVVPSAKAVHEVDVWDGLVGGLFSTDNAASAS